VIGRARLLPHQRRIRLAKDAEVGLRFVSRLKVVEIGVDQDGDPITSCVVEPVENADVSDHSAPVTERKLSPTAKIALKALEKAIAETGEFVASNTIPEKARVVQLSMWRAYAYRSGISTSDEERAKQKAFKACHDALVAGGKVAEWSGYVWIP
jgi:hypothetical protein